MTLLGFDAVNVNTLSTAALADPSMRFLFAKATEGMGWKAPDYANLRSKAATAGKLFGAYHYAWPNQDPLAEAQNFLSYSLLKPGEIPVFDIERQTDFPTSGLEADKRAWWERNIKFSVVWLTEVSKALGIKPVIYINRYWRTEMLKYSTAEQRAFLISHPLWLADPTGVGGQFGDIAEWPAMFHQYIMGTGIDNNWFKHDEARWHSLAIPKPVVPKTLDDIFDAVTQMESRLGTTLANLSNRVTALESDSASNKTAIASMVTQLNSVSAKVSSMDLTMRSVETKASNISGAVDSLDVQIGGVLAKVTENSVKADTLRKDIEELVTSMLTEFDSVTSVISELSTTVDGLKAEVNKPSAPKEIKLVLQDVS